MEDKNEDYEQKSQNIFNLINKYRANPRELANHLDKLKRYLDPSTNILSEPDKIQIQMVEGKTVFDEAIRFLRGLRSLPPLQWDDCLAQSAQEHVDDIGPKGLLLYQSSDGTEPEDRITNYGNYVDSLGENIDFGPNDELGVIVSLTLDDGEETSPHRDNLFKNDYNKVGIACGPHQTEFQMCVMDFAFDFIPKGKQGKTKDTPRQAVMNEQYNNVNMNQGQNKNNQSPYVKLSLENDDYKNYQAMDEEAKRRMLLESKNIGGGGGNNINEVDQLIQQVSIINSNKRVVKKEVEIITKITFTYEDGSIREVNDVKKHTFI